MNEKDQLLLSEDVCSQLHIITYHPAVSDTQPATTEHDALPVIVPCVRVKLLQMVRGPPLKYNRLCTTCE